MKLGFVISGMQGGGAERVLSIIANKFALDHQVNLFVFDHKPSYYELGENIMVHHLIEQSNKQSKLALLFSYIRAFFKMRKICKRQEISVLISFTTFANFFSIVVARMMGLKVYISERHEPKYYKVSTLMQTCRKWSYKYATGIVLQTERVRQSFKEIGVKLPRRQMVIYNPIDDSFRMQNNQRGKTILSVGRLSYEKGHDLLIRAFSLLPQNSSWTLDIVGDGPEMNNLKNLASFLNVADNIVFHGKSKEVYSYLNTCGIFVLPSRTEGFPNVLCEAMISGCPVVSFDCPNGPSELIQHQVNGILVEEQNVAKLSLAISQLIANSEMREELGNEASKLSADLNDQQICQQWRELISN